MDFYEFFELLIKRSESKVCEINNLNSLIDYKETKCECLPLD